MPTSQWKSDAFMRTYLRLEEARVNSTDELGGYGVSNPVREVHNL